MSDDTTTVSRRAAAIGLTLSPLASAADKVATSAAPHASVPMLEHAFDVRVTIGPAVELGTVDGLRKRWIPITGGALQGPRLEGVVLPGGGDWQTMHASGMTQIYARYTLRTADGTHVGVVNPGVRVASAEVAARIARGEDVDPALYYFRTTPSFEVPDGQHRWLRESVFIGSGVRRPDHVLIRFFRVT